MQAGLKVLIATTLCALPLNGTAAWAQQDAPPYPVWWSPSLELESLDRIDERLEQEIWPGREGFRVHLGLGSRRKTKVAKSCADISRFEREAAGAITSPDIYIWQVVNRACAPIERLREAKPATASFVNDFTLNAEAINYLPALVNLAPSCDWMCRLYAANARRIPWSKFKPDDFRNFEVKSSYEMVVETELDLVNIQILARADFNEDGWEDLFVKATTKGKEGRWGDSALFTLTRKTAEGILSVLNAEDYTCSPETYHTCDMYYDEPPALRETD